MLWIHLITKRILPPVTIETIPASNDRHDDDSIPLLQITHLRPDVLDDADGLVAHDVALLHALVDGALVHVQVGAADGAVGDVDDGVVGGGDGGFGDLVDGDVLVAFPDGGFHFEGGVGLVGGLHHGGCHFVGVFGYSFGSGFGVCMGSVLLCCDPYCSC